MYSTSITNTIQTLKALYHTTRTQISTKYSVLFMCESVKSKIQFILCLIFLYGWKGSKDRNWLCRHQRHNWWIFLFCEWCCSMLSHVVNFCLFIYSFLYRISLFVSVLRSHFLSSALSSVNVKNGADAVKPSNFILNSTDVQRKNEKKQKITHK